jgi:hypothetical protein
MSYTAVVIELPDEKGLAVFRKVDVSGGDSLSFLQKQVGGYIERVSSADGTVDLWVDEEGKLKSYPINNCATDLLWLLNPIFQGQDVLCGNVVLTGHKGPETASLPDGLWDLLKQMTWQLPVVFIEEDV